MKPSDKELLKILVTSGAPTKEIAKRLEVSEFAVHYNRKAAGMYPPMDYCDGDPDGSWYGSDGLCQITSVHSE